MRNVAKDEYMKRTAFSPHEGLYVQHLKTYTKHNMAVQHYHDAYEVYLQLEEKRYVFFDNMCHILEPGDLVIFKPFDIHYAESREVDYYARYVLNFHQEDLAVILSDAEINMLLKKLNSCVVHLNMEQMEAVLGFFQRIEGYSRQRGFLTKKLVYAELMQFLMYIVKCIKKEIGNKPNAIPPHMVQVLDYINKNYKEKMSVEEMAQVANMSKYHFCRIFHSVTGATPLEYVTNVRLTKVHNLLINTEMSIEEIARQTGFGVGTALTRVFKKVYGVSPRIFRNAKKNKC